MEPSQAMSRELKRVPMDFDWPVKEVWRGFVRPADAGPTWHPTEPPTGEGFQLWEYTSNGSPVSPVFASLEELAAWCADHATTFGRLKASAERWRAMLAANLVYDVRHGFLL